MDDLFHVLFIADAMFSLSRSNFNGGDTHTRTRPPLHVFLLGLLFSKCSSFAYCHHSSLGRVNESPARSWALDTAVLRFVSSVEVTASELKENSRGLEILLQLSKRFWRYLAMLAASPIASWLGSNRLGFGYQVSGTGYLQQLRFLSIFSYFLIAYSQKLLLSFYPRTRIQAQRNSRMDLWSLTQTPLMRLHLCYIS